MKEFGKLTADQFREFIGTLPEIKTQREEFPKLLASVPRHKLLATLGEDFNWGAIYELPFAKHIATAVVAFGIAPLVSAAAEADDPQQHFLDHIVHDGTDAVTHPDFSNADLIGLAFSIQRTVLSVMLFQRSMSGLVQEVREDGNLDSLFNAVRVDRAVMSCPTIADRIAQAELVQDKRFFQRLRNALKGPTRKHWEAYCDLRFSLYALREMGFNSMSDAQLEKLLVHTLKVYPNTPSARKNLRAQYQQSKRIKTI